jgi:hypothetical protein
MEQYKCAEVRLLGLYLRLVEHLIDNYKATLPACWHEM